MSNKPAKRSFLLLIISGFLFLFGGIFASVGYFVVLSEQRYATSGATATGTITNKTIEENWETDSSTKKRVKRSTYYIHYTFNPQDGTNPIQSKDSVDYNYYSSAITGDPLQIQYFVSDPASNRIAGKDDYIFGYVFSAIGSLTMLGAFMLCLYDMKKRRIEKRLYKEGMLVEALVTSVGPGNLSINGVQQWIIQYSFKDFQGQERKSKTSHMPPEKAQRWNIGDKAKVRYDKNDSSINIWVGDAA